MADLPEISDKAVDAFARAFNTCSHEGQHPLCCTRAGLSAALVASGWRPAGAGLVAVDPADLRTALEQRTGHSHRRPGIWDSDNPPWRANKPCAECAAKQRLLAVLYAAALDPAQPLPVADGSGQGQERSEEKQR